MDSVLEAFKHNPCQKRERLPDDASIDSFGLYHMSSWVLCRVHGLPICIAILQIEPREKKVLAPKASPPAKVSRRRVKPTRSSSSEGESRNVSPPRAKASRKSVVRTMSAKSAVPDDAGHSYKLRPRSGEARVYKDDSDTADEKEKVAMPLSEERRSQLKAQKQKRVKQEDIIVLDD